MDDLVTTDWLAAELGAPDLVVIDASWHMPATGRDGHAEYRSRHIPGARFLDIDAVADRTNPAPHMLPSAAEFGAAMERLGVGRTDRIIVYDNSPLRTAVRGWFMLRHFGAEQVAVLDGGLGAWLADGRATDCGEPPKRPARFDAVARRDVVAKADILAGTGLPLADARGAPRFEGSEADPRPGVAAGHIPGARNLPFARLYGQDGRLKSAGELRALFAAAGVDPERPFIASCGSGVTAGSLLFAAWLLGNRQGKLYDGSWSEWGADPATPKELGPAKG